METTPLELPYGKGKLSVDLPPGWRPDFFRPSPVSVPGDPQREVLRSLENPLGGTGLNAFRGARSVAIAISDETRPVPNFLILPPLLDQLGRMGIPPASTCLLVASGLHPPMAETRLPNILPSDILAEYPVVIHDAKQADLYDLGKTSRGTPVFLNPRFREADLRLVIGLIDPHQFVGYTGGVKAAAIGLAGEETIEANHSMLFQPGALVGEIENNPVREDIEEIGRMMGVHWVLNVVLDETNRVVRVFSGDPAEVERAGSRFCRTVYEATATSEYDLVIASPGGYPKDMNAYQAQKALAHVTPLVREGGDILFLAECQDGHGDDLFYQMMIKYRTPREVIDHFKKAKFKMGDHKAFLWCRSLVKAAVHLRSAMDEGLSKALMVSRVTGFKEVLERIGRRYASAPRVAVMPKANSTYVRIQKPL